MTPADNLARQVVAEAQAARQVAHNFTWAEPGLTLIINNRQAFHARQAIAQDLDRQIVRIAYRTIGMKA